MRPVIETGISYEDYDQRMELPDEDKIRTLHQQGWITLWHEDNWVKTEWFKDPKINIDWAGMTLKAAYKSILPPAYPVITGPARKDFDPDE